MEGEKASSTVLLNLNDDCLYSIFKKLDIRDQLQLVNTCERFRTIIREMIWRNQFQKFNDGKSKLSSQLKKQEYKDFYYHIADYIEELELELFVFELEVDFYLYSQLSRLRCFKWFSYRNDLNIMPKIVLNCPNLQVLEIRGDFIIDAHIKDMSNLRELYLPDCSPKIEHLRDIFKRLSLTHLDVSGCMKLPLEVTWPEFRFLKVTEHILTADFVEKLSYLRSLEILIVEYVDENYDYKKVYEDENNEHEEYEDENNEDEQNSSRDWIGLFDRLGSIITSVQIYQSPFSDVMSEFTKSTHKLTALKKIYIEEPIIDDFQTFAQLSALKEFHMITNELHTLDLVAILIDQTKNLEFFHWHFLPLPFEEEWNTEEIEFGWLLEVIRILRNKKERTKLCLNISFPNMDPICVKIRHLVMKEQQLDTDPLLEVTFDRSSLNEFTHTENGYCMELYLDRI